MRGDVFASVPAHFSLFAQIVGIPTADDILKAYATSLLMIVVWAALVVASLMVLVIGLFQIRRRHGKAMAICGAGIATFLACIAFVRVVPPHHSVVLDLSSSRTPPAGKWTPNGLGGELFCSQGRVDVVLKLPGDKRFEDRASLLVLDRHNQQIDSVSISTSGMPLEQACALTQKYLKAWAFDYKNFDRWCADRRTGVRTLLGDENLFFSYQNFAYPSLTLELRGSENSWTLQLRADWPRDDLSATPLK